MEFKIGDRVIATNSLSRKETIGVTGTVKGYFDEYNVAVEFDKDVNGHDFQNYVDITGNILKGEYGKCWFCMEYHLKSVEYKR